MKESSEKAFLFEIKMFFHLNSFGGKQENFDALEGFGEDCNEKLFLIEFINF